MTTRRGRAVLPISALLLAAALYGVWTPDLDRTELLHRYGTSSQHVLEVEGLSVNYQDSGPSDAPVLLLLHGFGSSLQTWDTWVTQLAQSYRVIRLDLPGFGLTGPSPANNYTEQQDISTLIQFVDRLGVSTFSVVGHSLGGKMAWALAAMQPDRVKALVLMAPDGFAPEALWGTRPYEVSAPMGLMTYCLPKYVVRGFIEVAFADPQWLSDPMLNRYHDMLRAPGVRGAILERAGQTVYTNPIPRLQQITAPTLLIWGANDRMIPSSNASSYAKVLQHSDTVILPGLGHVIQEEQPEVGLRHVERFLKTVLQPAPNKP